MQGIFSIPVDKDSQYLFAFTWEKRQYTWTVMSQDFIESSYISQTLKADLDDVKFSAGSTLLQYIDDLLLCSPSQTSSQEDHIHLLKNFGLKET